MHNTDEGLASVGISELGDADDMSIIGSIVFDPSYRVRLILLSTSVSQC